MLAFILSTALAGDITVPVELPTVRSAEAITLADRWWIPPAPDGQRLVFEGDGPTPTERRLTRLLQGTATAKDLRKLFGSELIGFSMVTVSAHAITVSGREAVTLLDGQVDPTDLDRGRIPALSDALVQPIEATKVLHEQLGGPGYTPRLVLAIDARVPSATVGQVLYTAGIAGISQFDVLVATQATPTEPRQSPSGTAVRADIRLEADLSTARISDEAGIRQARPIAFKGALLREAHQAPLGCVTIHLPTDLPWQRVAETMASAHGAGAAWSQVSVMGVRSPSGPMQATGRTTTTLPSNALVPALPLRLPALGPPPDGTEPPCPE